MLCIKDINSHLVYSLVFSAVIVCSELVPATFIVINIVQRLRKYRQTKQAFEANQRNSSTYRLSRGAGASLSLRKSQLYRDVNID